MPSTRIVFAGLLVAWACSSSSTGPNPNPGPDLGFLVQVLTAPPGSTAAGTAVPILFKILHKESDIRLVSPSPLMYKYFQETARES